MVVENSNDQATIYFIFLLDRLFNVIPTHSPTTPRWFVV